MTALIPNPSGILLLFFRQNRYHSQMRYLPEDSDDAAWKQRLAARRLLMNEFFWIAGSVFLLILGLISMFGIVWLLWAAAAGITAIAARGFLPGVKTKNRMAWEEEREALLVKWSLVVGNLSKTSREL